MYEAKVLVIDDEQTYLNLITETLKDKNYKILQALDGKMGCMVAQKFIPDIIITDWEMPELNGIETIIELKKNPVTKDIPVIMCTGIMTSSENLNAALNAGAVDYIRKPIEPIELIARINSAINLSDSIKKIKQQNEKLLALNTKVLQKNEELLLLNATKDKFFSIIAHDLRNPFNNILGLTELLVMSPGEYEPEKTIKIIKTIYNSSQSAYKLLGNLLEWSMSQTGRTEFNPEDVEIEQIIANILDVNSASSIAKNIEITYEISAPGKLFADRNMLITILGNLVTNAIKYTNKNGKVRIEVIYVDDHVKISVIDNGVGIEPKMINKLFRINEKTSTKGTEKENGTGLGLILCKEFVEKHNGNIGVESQLAKGSNFWIMLPCSKLDENY